MNTPLDPYVRLVICSSLFVLSLSSYIPQVFSSKYLRLGEISMGLPSTLMTEQRSNHLIVLSNKKKLLSSCYIWCCSSFRLIFLTGGHSLTYLISTSLNSASLVHYASIYRYIRVVHRTTLASRRFIALGRNSTLGGNPSPCFVRLFAN